MSNTPTNPLSPEEIAAVQSLLSRLQPGFLPLPIFLEIARLTVSSIVEVVPLRRQNGTIQVLLTKRPADDPHWPGMLHTPGTVVRATDDEDSHASAFHRVFDEELAGIARAGEPQFVQSHLHKGNRGMENASIFVVEVTGEPTVGTFYDVYALPASIVASQIDFIQAAARQFSQSEQS